MIKPDARWFCMACGAGFVAPLRYGEGRDYGMAPPDVAVPGYCKAPACAEQRRRFEATVERILAEAARSEEQR